MDSIEWSKLPELGIQEVDDEHREILGMINALRNLLRSDTRDAVQCDTLKGVLNDSVGFIRNHFASEETMMRQSFYPGYIDHKREHDLFLEQLNDLQKQVQAGTKSLTAETLNLMGNWLHHHVLETDRPLVPHLLRARLRRQSPYGTERDEAPGQFDGFSLAGKGDI
jgi:hemerythrin-like metal-binding protein